MPKNRLNKNNNKKDASRVKQDGQNVGSPRSLGLHFNPVSRREDGTTQRNLGGAIERWNNRGLLKLHCPGKSKKRNRCEGENLGWKTCN